MKLYEILKQKKSDPVNIEGVSLFFRPFTLQDFAFFQASTKELKDGEDMDMEVCAKLTYNQLTDESKQEFEDSFDTFKEVMDTDSYAKLWDAFGKNKKDSEPEESEKK